jgi:YfiH family protein
VSLQWLTADWPAPAPVRTLISTRRGGVSDHPFTSNNLALHVGDNPQHVAVNRQQLAATAGSIDQIQWLRQVHGVAVVDASNSGQIPEADACVTDIPGTACAVLTADCLPILLCDRNGTQVAAVHAGWRGLAAGILPIALKRFTSKPFAVEPEDILVYLGPAISQAHFQVGPEVRQAFLASVDALALGVAYEKAVENAFSASLTAGHFQADLYDLARSQCKALGIDDIYGGHFCTYTDENRFYSYRRDGETGRMASLIWLAR